MFTRQRGLVREWGNGSPVNPVNPEIPVIIPHDNISLQLLQRIRDEAHRFAITFHRAQRLKRQTKSELDEIKGLGPKKKEILKDAFKNVDAIKNASLEELNLVKGIDKTTARNVYEHFHVD